MRSPSISSSASPGGKTPISMSWSYAARVHWRVLTIGLHVLRRGYDPPRGASTPRIAYPLAAGQSVRDQRADDGDGERVVQQRQAETRDEDSADQRADREPGIGLYQAVITD